MIDGSAGAIAVLLNLQLVEAASTHGDLLLSEACRNDKGWSWKTIPSVRNLTGFSHGASGIAWALLELYNVTGEARFRDAALEAFRYERHCFNPTEQNWPDFRDRQTSFPVYWCHGAAGIALVTTHEKLLADAFQDSNPFRNLEIK